MEDRDLNRCVTSLAGSEPLYSIPCSIDDSRLELMMGSSRKQNLASFGSPSNSRQDNPWHYQYHLQNGFRGKDLHGDFAPQDNDQILLRAKEDFALQNLKRFSINHIGKNPDEISANLRVNGDKRKIISRTGSSQLVAKKTLKEKGTASRFSEACSVVMDQKDKMLGYEPEVASSIADVKPSGPNYQNFSDGILRSSPESNTIGISLREWLKSESTKVNKFERHRIFRQIVHLVDFAHSKGSALQDLRPSCFTILPSNKIQYTGSLVTIEIRNVMPQNLNKKRPLDQNPFDNHIAAVKQQKLSEAVRSLRNLHKIGKDTEFYTAGPHVSASRESQLQKDFSYQNALVARKQQSITLTSQLEKKWYTSPDEFGKRGCSFPSNIYGLGVLLFELLCCFESWEAQTALMLDLCHRILPGKFLSENPMESAFCLWLLHPEPLSRPTSREILQTELISGPQDSGSVDIFTNSSAYSIDPQSELLLKFFSSLKQEKERHALKLIEHIGFLEEDIREIERKYLSRTDSVSSWEYKELPGTSIEGFCLEESSNSDHQSSSFSVSIKNEDRLTKNITQLENAYFTMRSQIRRTAHTFVMHSDKDLQKKEQSNYHAQNKSEDLGANQTSNQDVGAFFDGLCKFARFSKFKVCGTLRNGDLFNSTNAICSLSFDRDEEYIAAAKVSKKIKIFEFSALSNDAADIHYPVVEMSNKSKLSCICWNHYIKNYLASTDYDGVVKMWDASSGEGFTQYTEHQKRAWSVDFSRADPTMFASGSDDCSVKLWSLNDKSSIGTIWSPANVCCVQFSDYFNHQLVFGSADYKIYGYDLRHVRVPLCTLAGHRKAVSYVKFLDAHTLVSASTDNTLKLWNLKKTASANDSCSLSFMGHTNEKNFVGLSVLDGYIVCGSETNEVYSYHRSLPMPITSHKFKSVDPVSGHEISDDSGQFVSSVCWRRKSNMVVAANSGGVLKLLQMV